MPGDHFGDSRYIHLDMLTGVGHFFPLQWRRLLRRIHIWVRTLVLE